MDAVGLVLVIQTSARDPAACELIRDPTGGKTHVGSAQHWVPPLPGC
jgi:hypothetical protein